MIGFNFNIPDERLKKLQKTSIKQKDEEQKIC